MDRFNPGDTFEHIRKNVIHTIIDEVVELQKLPPRVTTLETEMDTAQADIQALKDSAGTGGEFSQQALLNMIDNGAGNVDASVSGDKIQLNRSITGMDIIEAYEPEGGNIVIGVATEGKFTARYVGNAEVSAESVHGVIGSNGNVSAHLHGGKVHLSFNNAVTDADKGQHGTPDDPINIEPTWLATHSILNVTKNNSIVTLPKVTGTVTADNEVGDGTVRYVSFEVDGIIQGHEDDDNNFTDYSGRQVFWKPDPRKVGDKSDASKIKVKAGNTLALVSYGGQGYDSWIILGIYPRQNTFVLAADENDFETPPAE